MPGHAFTALKRLRRHEDLRSYLSFYDSAADVRDAQDSGLVADRVDPTFDARR